MSETPTDMTVTIRTPDRDLTMAKEEFDRAAAALSGEGRDDLDFRRSDEVRELAERLIEQHPSLEDLSELSLLYLLRSTADPTEPGMARIDAIAKAVKAPAIWRDVFGVDAAIWVDARWWGSLDERRREAIVLHGLLHIGVTDAGKVKLLDHDVDEFSMVARLYGQWRPSLERFAEQLALFEAEPR